MMISTRHDPVWNNVINIPSHLTFRSLLECPYDSLEEEDYYTSAMRPYSKDYNLASICNTKNSNNDTPVSRTHHIISISARGQKDLLLGVQPIPFGTFEYVSAIERIFELGIPLPQNNRIGFMIKFIETKAKSKARDSEINLFTNTIVSTFENGNVHIITYHLFPREYQDIILDPFIQQANHRENEILKQNKFYF